jgi:hypothetical protein
MAPPTRAASPSLETADLLAGGMMAGMAGPTDEQPEERVLQVAIDPTMAGGVWANFARVHHSEHEFTVDFVRIDYAAQPNLTGVVVARVAVSPLFVTQLIAALQENWDMYAKKAMPREVYGDDDESD